MRKLLFAPADPRTCDALETALRAHKNVWEAQIVCGAGSVQDRLGETELDAVVADLGCESGRSVLSRARESFPEVVRIGVVTQRQMKLPQLSFVHQVVSNPLDLKELEVAVERSCRLRDLLKGERICQTVGELGELPTAPAVYLQLMQKLNQPDTSISEIAEIVEGDVAVSAKLLQLVNSIVFRTAHEIVTVKMAASFLGLDVIKNLVLSLETFRAFEKMREVPRFSLDELQAHCRLTAAIAGQMQLPNDLRDAAIVASLLHDIGKLVIAYKMPDRFSRLMDRARAQQQPLYKIEEELWGITHAEVGAYLLGLWGLPIRVTEAIAYHHSPLSVPHRCFDALTAVYVANLLAHDAEGTGNDQEWDMSLLENLGVADKLAGWKTTAEQMALLQRESSQNTLAAKRKQKVPVA